MTVDMTPELMDKAIIAGGIRDVKQTEEALEATVGLGTYLIQVWKKQVEDGTRYS